jgi:hypothetical protein
MGHEFETDNQISVDATPEQDDWESEFDALPRTRTRYGKACCAGWAWVRTAPRASRYG